MPINVVCPKCKGKCVVADQNLGKTIRCGLCKGLFTAPKANPSPSPVKPAKSPASMTVVCPKCRGKCIVANENLGKAIRCGLCKATFTAPKANASPSSSSVKPAATVSPIQKGRKQPVSPIKPAAPKQGVRVLSSGKSLPQKTKKFRALHLLILLGGAAAACMLFLVVAGVLAFVFLRNSTASSGDASSERAEVNKPAENNGEQDPNEQPNAKDEAAVAQNTPNQEPTPKESLPDSISRDDLQRVKDATVFLHVTRPDGRVFEGSGFSGHGPGLIITNAHVLGMLEDWSSKPKTVEVVRHRGGSDEKKLKATIVGVDRSSDLAVLRVPGANVGAPLKICNSTGLYETQPVYVVGYPLGSRLGAEITISETKISALRDPDHDGVLDKVQTNTGMEKGNSGGPVVNTAGEVVGVVVSGIRNTNINFAIAGDTVNSTLNGRVANVSFFVRKMGGKMHMNVDAELIDPLKHVKGLLIDFWTGKKGPVRNSSHTSPAALPGDSVRTTLTLDPSSNSLSGSITMPELQTNQAYWYQPVLVCATGEKFWQAARMYQPSNDPGSLARLPNIPDLKEEAAELTLRYVKLPRTLKLSSFQSINLRLPGRRPENFGIKMVTTMQERPVRYDSDTGIADIRLQYKRYSITMPTRYFRKDPSLRSRVQNMANNAHFMAADLSFNRSGKLVKNSVDVSRVPLKLRRSLTGLHGQIQDSLEALEVPFPGRKVQPLQSWRATRKLNFLGNDDSLEIPATMQLTYRYLGTCKRNNRKQAVLQVYGKVTSQEGLKAVIRGKASGLAYFDLGKGQLTEAEVTVSTELKAASQGRTVRLETTLKSKLERIFSDITPTTPPPTPGGKYVLNVQERLPNGRQKEHRVHLMAGKSYTIELTSKSFDTCLALFDSSGRMVAGSSTDPRKDRRPNKRRSRLQFRARASGRYRLVVRSVRNILGGQYHLTVR